MRNNLLIFLLLAFAGWHCQNLELEELEFVEVRTDPFAVEQLGVLTMHGIVQGLTETPGVTACGFLLATNEVAISAAVPQGQTIGVASLPIGNDRFSASFSALKPGERVHFRAFATLEKNGLKRTVYGEVLSYIMGEVVANIGSADIQNNSATVQGLLIGLGTLGITAESYGHVYSATNSQPNLSDIGVNCDSTLFGKTTGDNFVFDSRLKGLAFNQCYYVRAYVTDGANTFYSPVDTFCVQDGWEKLLPFQFYQGGSAVVLNGRAYIGFGCDEAAGCADFELSNELWAFDPSSGTWTPQNPLPNTLTRQSTTLFSIGDTLYALGGEQRKNGTIFILNQFWKYHPDANGGQWEEINSNAPKLSGAVALVLNNRAYVGTGYTTVSGQVVGTNRFWEYNPETGSWREVVPLPLQKSAGDPVSNISPRVWASAFALENGLGYVGGGLLDPVLLLDWWEFTPPSPSGPSGDLGSWNQVGFFPGPARQEAISFGIGNRGFYGCGLNLPDEIGALNDLWEFDGDTRKWILQPRTNFQGGPRRNLTYFAIGDTAYAGGGLGRDTISSGGYVGQPKLRGDFWRYIPRKL